MSDLSQNMLLSASFDHGSRGRTISPKSGNVSHSQVTLNELLIPKPASTIIFPVRAAVTQHGLNEGDLLIVDRDAVPKDNQLVIVSVNNDLIVKRFNRYHPNSPVNSEDFTENGHIRLHIWGIVTYIIRKQ